MSATGTIEPVIFLGNMQIDRHILSLIGLDSKQIDLVTEHVLERADIETKLTNMDVRSGRMTVTLPADEAVVEEITQQLTQAGVAISMAGASGALM